MDDRLLDFATPRQAELLRAAGKHGSDRKAAKALGCNKSLFSGARKAVKKKAAAQGYSPDHDMVHVVPDPFVVKGISSYYGPDGKLRGQWVKSSMDTQKQIEAIQEAVSAFYADQQPVAPQPAPVDVNTDIIPWFEIGDAHFGMLAHAAEVGENFDLKIAEQDMREAFARVINEVPACERCVINDLGDFTHYENFDAKTEASGIDLDFDSRFPKMIKIYSRTMRFIIDRALTRFQTVDVIINQANHSRTNDIWMAELLRVAYPERVNVLNNDTVFIAYRMGRTFVMVHHSDKCKPKDLAGVMATDFAKDWGETRYRYIDIGHIHHSMVSKEHPGVQIESFNQLAGADKWAHDHGYRNRKSITVIQRSKTYGEISRRTLSIEEVRDRLGTRQPRKRAFVA